jgi:hypothetical protein
MFVIIIVMFTLGLTLVATPLNWIPGIDYDVTRTSGTVDVGSVTIDIGSIAGASINTLPEALLASGLGVICCLIGLHAVNLIAWILKTLTERLLELGASSE